MESEQGFDVEQFAQDGLDAAGVTQEEVVDVEPGETQTDVVVPKPEPKKAEEQPKEEHKETPTAEEKPPSPAAEEPESVISQLIPKAEEAKPVTHTVPVEDHIKLRQRAQQAERERDELRQQLQTTTQQQAQEISPLKKWAQENPDDAQVGPPPASIQIEYDEWKERRDAERAEAQRKSDEAAREAAEANRKVLEGAQTMANRARTSEEAFRKETPDYVTITKAAINANLVSADEKNACLKAENPAKALYETAKAKLDAIRGALGITAPATKPQEKPANATPEGEEEPEMTDDEIFEDIFKKKPKPSE